MSLSDLRKLASLSLLPKILGKIKMQKYLTARLLKNICLVWIKDKLLYQIKNQTDKEFMIHKQHMINFQDFDDLQIKILKTN